MTDEEYQSLLMEDNMFNILSQIGFVGNPATQKLDGRAELIRFEILLSSLSKTKFLKSRINYKTLKGILNK